MTQIIGDIINKALKSAGVLGVGQTALPDDISDAMLELNWMLSQWKRKRWLVYHLVDLPLVANGNTMYTVGPGGDFDVSSRPDRIESAFVRQLITTPAIRADFPLLLIEARETYNNIVLKQYNSFPQSVFYDTAYPLGFLYVIPIPNAGQYEIHISLKDVLPQFVNMTDSVVLPEEYFAALYFNLARRLRIAYQLPADPELNGMATDALNVVRGADLQLARLQMPPGLPGVGKGSYGQGLFGGGTAPAALAITEDWAGGAIVTPGTYTILGSAPYQFMITGVAAVGGNAGGSFNVSVSVNGAPVPGLQALPVSGAAVQNWVATGQPLVGPTNTVELTIDTVVGTPTNSYVTVTGLRT